MGKIDTMTAEESIAAARQPVAVQEEAVAKERDRCARIADDEARIRAEAGTKHPEESEARWRCFAGARAAANVAKGIRSGEVVPLPKEKEGSDALRVAGVSGPLGDPDVIASPGVPTLTDERITQLGHRYAWRYKHGSPNPADAAQAIYTYNAHCLRDLLRAAERELLDGGDKWTPTA